MHIQWHQVFKLSYLSFMTNKILVCITALEGSILDDHVGGRRPPIDKIILIITHIQRRMSYCIVIFGSYPAFALPCGTPFSIISESPDFQFDTQDVP